MRPANFTPEQIIQAGLELRDAGRNITGFALRQKIGGGNPSRLKQIWDEYINSQAVVKNEPVAELPIEVAEEVAAVTKSLTDRLATLAVELNDKAVKAAERRVAEVIRTAGEQREQAERELNDASQTVEELENKLDEARDEAEDFERRLGETQENLQAQAVQLAQVRERLALTEQSAKTAAEEHAAALAVSRKEAQDLVIERDNLRAELMKAQASAGAAEKAAAVAAQKHAEALNAANQATKEISKERDREHAEKIKLQARIDSAEADAHKQADRLLTAQKERDSALKVAQTAREDAAKLGGQVETLQAQAAELLRTLAGRSNGEEAVPPAPKGGSKPSRGKS